MNNAAFALLVLAAGYIAARRSLIWRPHVFRSDGHALYFLVVVTALAVAAFSGLALHEIEQLPRVGTFARDCLARLLKAFGAEPAAQSLGSIALVSVPTAFLLAWMLNIPLVACRTLRAALLMRLSCLSELEEFLWATTSKQLPVMLTMASSKVYVGFAIDTSTTRGEREWVRIEPFLSGYRDDKQSFEPVTDYTWLHTGSADPAQRSIEEFDILLPADEIRSVHAFDLPTYLTKFKQAEPFEGPLQQTRPPREVATSVSKAERFYMFYVGGIFSMPVASFFFGAIGLATGFLLTSLCGRASMLEETDNP
ncbi:MULTISPECIES: hypothetical protein [Luteibacter]|uniref:hypothetical protein n=1 Tax=Luteibacter sp. dw_328 TaxID=2719796 RepID=UPI0007BF8717|nr:MULTISPECIES: hypothetical protein [Luteibacter]